MLGEEIKVNSFIDAIKVLHENKDKYDVLIDFHDRKKWIKSNNITITLISPEKYSFSSKERKERKGKERGGYCIIDIADNSIKYICDISGRYEYYFKGIINCSLHLEAFYATRDDVIYIFNKNTDVFVDNGENNKDYDNPYIEAFLNDIRDIYKYYPKYKRLMSRYKMTIMPSEPFMLNNREDGGIEIREEKSGELYYVCNIGKRYEYFKKGEYKDSLTHPISSNCDIIVELIPDKKRRWIPVEYTIDPKNNPYNIRKRKDGGIELISIESGTLKYICNIGKRFYYIPSDENNGIF
jgi:hypothetical protein